jgi:alpha-amylase/alpha-mannosidase (GH57 family)
MVLHVTDTNLILWWHHHQPWYLHPDSHRSPLPWVRMHACRGYLDMATAAAHPSAERVRHTFNFVPSLLDQLLRYTQDPQASDLWMDLARPRPQDMTAAQVSELLVRMGGGGPTPVRPLTRLQALRGRVAAKDRMSAQDLMDLQVLAHLGFCGWTLAERPGPAATLMEKGHGFTQEEKEALLAQMRAVCGEVVATYRALQDAGRVEITATPYFHPILPLLLDSDVMAEALPDRPRPPRYAWPSDARAQVEQGVARVEQLLGKRPLGMWPAEGSVSTAAVALMGQAGVAYCCTDERVLRRSIAEGGAALDHGRPWLDPSGKVAMFFRDHAVSDLLGFSYRHMTAEAAAADLVARVKAFGSARARAHETPVMTVILDGENPWEHYPRAGQTHLLALQQALSASRGIRSVTPSQHLTQHPPTTRLTHVHAGSWIDGNFAIWIGHDEDRRGWALLGEARKAIDKAEREGAPPERIQAALKALMPAQGSDWFWWFGEEFEAREADLYDELFREQVRSVYVTLGIAAPARLNHPIKHQKGDAGNREPPGTLHDPVVSGDLPSHAAWAGAVKVQARSDGAMARATGALREVWLGLTGDALWLCVFPDGAVPRGTLTVALGQGHPRTLQVDLDKAAAPEAQVAVGACITVRWPLVAAGLQGGEGAEVHVELTGLDGTQRVPQSGGVRLEIPDSAQRWRGAWA